MQQARETTTQRRERRASAWGLSFTWLLVLLSMQVVAAVGAICWLIGAAVARGGQSVLHNQTYLTQVLMRRYLGSVGWILIISDIATVLVFLAIVKGRHASFRATVGLRRFKPLLIVALLMLGGGLSLILNSGEQILTALLPVANSSSVLDLTFNQLFTSIPGVLSIVVLAPIAEEIAFRGMVLGTLREKLALPVAFIMQAVIFGVIHGNLSQGVMAIGLGCLLAWVYLRSGSIICSMLVHFSFNGTTALIALVTGSAGAGPLLLWALLLVVATGLFVGGLLWQLHLTRKPKPALAQAPTPGIGVALTPSMAPSPAPDASPVPAPAPAAAPVPAGPEQRPLPNPGQPVWYPTPQEPPPQWRQ
ncbi:MAG: CPBP family intramembrane metalloprotease [Coriobacteriia bacterium]|nr:CPBP family intramembrane metalloprotease [Coriobacteriia bacterium]